MIMLPLTVMSLCVFGVFSVYLMVVCLKGDCEVTLRAAHVFMLSYILCMIL